MQLRAGLPSDSYRLAEIHTVSRRAAYAPFLDADYLAGLSAAEEEPSWAERLANREHVIIVATGDDGVVQGYTWLYSGDLDDGTGEIANLYIHPDYWRAGMGTALFKAAEQALQDQGARNAVLWVYEENAPARAFYEAHGWAADGAVRDGWGRGKLSQQLRYARRLQD